MANQLTREGILKDTSLESLEKANNAFRLTYGSDVDLSSNTSDGNIINIFVQALQDVLNLVVDVFNGFNLETAIGIQLDNIGSILSIRRQSGTYTLQQIEITVDRDLFLEGLDSSSSDEDGAGYTVADGNGNKFILLDSINLTANTTTNLTFRAEILGEINTLSNTITEPVTVILGVTKINNPTTATSIGLEEELDAPYRLRLQRAQGLPSQGYRQGLETALLALEDVTEARVYENRTDFIDEFGIPPHSIWAIVEGGSNLSIANVISIKLTAGTGMKGDTIVQLVNSGVVETIKFDRVISEALYIKFSIQPIDYGTLPSMPILKKYIVDNLPYGIGSPADINRLSCVILAGIKQQGSNAVALNIRLSSDGVNYYEYIPINGLNKKWIVAINGSGNPEIDITIL